MKITNNQGAWHMKPRIFISSTFYDLKYVREDISNFVKAHDFEPIMFEDGDIGYTPGKSLDKSCYETMHSADMVLLIIGGNYGSPSSIDSDENNKFGEYTSITRQEFKTAQEDGIPVFVFVEAAVYAEFGVYELNKERIKKLGEQFVFSATKNLNIFSFISEIKSIGNISITEFKRPSEIKDFLGKQWSDMFKNYLKALKDNTEQKKTHDSIADLRTAIQEMQLLVNGLFEKTFNNQIEIEYDSVKNEQRNIKARNIARNIEKSIYFELNVENEIEALEKTKVFIDFIVQSVHNVGGYEDDINRAVSAILDLSIELDIRIKGIMHSLIKDEDGYMNELYQDEELKANVIDIIAENKINESR